MLPKIISAVGAALTPEEIQAAIRVVSTRENQRAGIFRILDELTGVLVEFHVHKNIAFTTPGTPTNFVMRHPYTAPYVNAYKETPINITPRSSAPGIPARLVTPVVGTALFSSLSARIGTDVDIVNPVHILNNVSGFVHPDFIPLYAGALSFIGGDPPPDPALPTTLYTPRWLTYDYKSSVSTILFGGSSAIPGGGRELTDCEYSTSVELTPKIADAPGYHPSSYVGEQTVVGTAPYFVVAPPSLREGERPLTRLRDLMNRIYWQVRLGKLHLVSVSTDVVEIPYVTELPGILIPGFDATSSYGHIHMPEVRVDTYTVTTVLGDMYVFTRAVSDNHGLHPTDDDGLVNYTIPALKITIQGDTVYHDGEFLSEANILSFPLLIRGSSNLSHAVLGFDIVSDPDYYIRRIIDDPLLAYDVRNTVSNTSNLLIIRAPHLDKDKVYGLFVGILPSSAETTIRSMYIDSVAQGEGKDSAVAYLLGNLNVIYNNFASEELLSMFTGPGEYAVLPYKPLKPP